MPALAAHLALSLWRCLKAEWRRLVAAPTSLEYQRSLLLDRGDLFRGVRRRPSGGGSQSGRNRRWTEDEDAQLLRLAEEAQEALRVLEFGDLREGQAVELFWQEGESEGEWFAAVVRQLTAESVLLYYEKTHEEERIQRSDVTRGMLRLAASPSSGKSKKKKDKNAPKRARTAFNFFAKQVRADMCEKASSLNQPAPSIADVNQRVSALWGTLDADGRKPFAALAEVRSHRSIRSVRSYRG